MARLRNQQNRFGQHTRKPATLPRTADLPQRFPKVRISDGVTDRIQHAVDVAEPVTADDEVDAEVTRFERLDHEHPAQREPADGERDEEEGDGAECLAILLLRGITPTSSRRGLLGRCLAIEPVADWFPRLSRGRVCVHGRRRQFDVDGPAADDAGGGTHG